jgi:16S rRNA (guanine(966)-N(2))-methyltransferase RsmD
VRLRHAPQQVRIIGGLWKRSTLPVAVIDGLRPTPDRVRETVFNWLGQTLDGLACLDLFAGTGALGFEAASRGAKRVVLVERHPRAVAQLRAIKQKLSADSVDIAEADAVRFLQSQASDSVDIVFLDPPFDSRLLADVFARALNVVMPGGAVYVESKEPVEALGPLPEGWIVDRRGRAGLVHYHLLRREIE